MTTTYYTYQFRLKPNKTQQELLNKHFGCVRLVYNLGLELKKTLYNNHGLSISKNELIKQKQVEALTLVETGKLE